MRNVNETHKQDLHASKKMKHMQAISKLKERYNQVVTLSILNNMSNRYYICKDRNMHNSCTVSFVFTKLSSS